MLMISTCNGLNWLERKVHEAVGGDIPAVPRCCGRQRGRDNVPAQEPEEYFKRSVTIPFLDHLRNKLEQRFSSDQQRVVQGLSLIPAVMKENPKLEKTGCGIGNNDLPSEGNLDMEISHKISPQLHFRHKLVWGLHLSLYAAPLSCSASPLNTVKAILSTTHASRLDVRIQIGWDHANVSIPASKTWK
ncbi:hypothetical protein EMCRGX_G007787 [Ephydatia muelleri]